MADTDETRIIAWLDGELAPAEAETVAADVAADADLLALAERHRRLRARFAAAFDPLAAAPATTHSAQVISLADARAARAPKTKPRRWWIPGAIAASLALAVGWTQFRLGTHSDGELAPQIAQALDRQLSGDAGPIRVALTFRNRSGAYCRSFNGQAQSGIACRTGNGWHLRYAAPDTAKTTDYRMAGSPGDTMNAIGGMIVGDPLDRAEEQRARADDWK